MSSLEVNISNGNTKLGNILNINLPPIRSCPPNVPCATEKCYALKAWKQYANVRNAWTHNYNLYKIFPSNIYFESIINQLKRKTRLKKGGRVRWHSSGDIVD